MNQLYPTNDPAMPDGDIRMMPARHRRIGDGSTVSDGDRVKTPFGVGVVSGVEITRSSVRIGVFLRHQHGDFGPEYPGFFWPAELVQVDSTVDPHTL
ncbi:MAG TPA: hypothetical protein VF292_03175 [Rhodanobacteraceae bacterium]